MTLVDAIPRKFVTIEHVAGKFQSHFRPTYDIILRPRSSFAPRLRRDLFVNFLQATLRAREPASVKRPQASRQAGSDRNNMRNQRTRSRPLDTNAHRRRQWTLHRRGRCGHYPRTCPRPAAITASALTAFGRSAACWKRLQIPSICFCFTSWVIVR